MGSIYQRKADQRWVVAVVIEGKRFTRYAKDEAEAKAIHAELERQADLGQKPVAPLTVGQLLDRWLVTEAPRLKPKTLANYQVIVESIVRPRIGKVKLARLTPDRLQRLLDDLADRPRMAHATYRALNRCFELAVRWQYLQANPCQYLTPPTYRAKRPTLPTADDLVRFLSAIEDHDLWPWLTLAAHTGMRPGEIAALRWGDIDWERGTLTVARSGSWLKLTGEERSKWVETTPKTASGHRVLSLSPQAIHALKRQRSLINERRLQSATWNDHGFAFPGEDGEPAWWTGKNKQLARLCTAHGLPVLTLHKLRHLHASLLLAQGVPVASIAKRLGHSNVSITLSTYSHCIEDDSRAVEAIQRALG